MKLRIASINISKETGVVKQPVQSALVENTGIPEDAHSGLWHRQISILGKPSIVRFEKALNRRIYPGEFGENLTLEGFDLKGAGRLDRFIIGEVELEVTQIGKTCHGDNCAIFREVGKCVMPQEGLFARVVTPGKIETGQEVEYIPSRQGPDTVGEPD